MMPIQLNVSYKYPTLELVDVDSVADLGFPRGGGANPKGGRQLIIWPIFPKNCMKMKKFWARGGARAPRAPLRSATGSYTLRMILEKE